MNKEHFIETEWCGFYVGSYGTIMNQTGVQSVQYRTQGDLYVGLENDGHRSMKKLSNLVYKYHINRGKELDPEMTVRFKDNNQSNCSASNLYIDFKEVHRPFNPRYRQLRSVNR
jgi:hypothetical protein